jgi:nucleoside triphosphate pyrophosphatase
MPASGAAWITHSTRSASPLPCPRGPPPPVPNEARQRAGCASGAVARGVAGAVRADAARREPMKQTRALCLASASPRRAELLRRFGLDFAVFAPQVDERALPGEGPLEHVARLAGLKARAARAGHPRHGILAGDTVVVLGEELLGKPADAGDAERMLTRLSGMTHRVLSAYRLLDADSGEESGQSVETRVTFRRLPQAWLRWYSRLDETRDKAGAYGIQGIGGAMVERIEGSYSNVVGFPIETIVWDLLARGWLAL